MTTNQTTLILDPLEQFEVISYKCVFFSNLHYQFLLVYATIFLFLVFNNTWSGYSRSKPNIVLLRDASFRFIVGLIRQNLNVKAVLFFPVIYLTFLVLLFGNLAGILPFTFTITGSAVVTFFFAVTFFVGIAAIGYSNHKGRFFGLLLPAGIPWYLIPFLLPVEVASYLAKLCSLGARLFANTLSGHSLLKLLVTLVWVIVCHSSGPVFIYFFPLATVVLVTLLEAAVAFLQAYVFVVLISVYLNDAVCIKCR